MTRKVSLARVAKSYASPAAALKLPGIDQGGAMNALADRFGSASDTLLDAAVDQYLNDADFEIDRAASDYARLCLAFSFCIGVYHHEDRKTH
jgi:hypothetical protein